MDEPLADKYAIIQVLGSIVKKPGLLRQPNYSLEPDDFPERFHKIVFGALENLAKNGTNSISVIDVDQLLHSHPEQYLVFTGQDGLKYLSAASDAANVENFDYYYGIVKKFSVLRALEKNGVDIACVYNRSLTAPKEIEEQRKKFDDYSVSDLVEIFEGRVMAVKNKFCLSTTSRSAHVGSRLSELVDDYKRTPEMGSPLVSPTMTAIARGRRIGTFYLESAASGVGKTRRNIGEACKAAIPYYYNTSLKKWEYYGDAMAHPTLFISTELSADECETMFGAFLSGVPEDKILDGRMTAEEEERVKQAAVYLEKYPLFFIQMTDFDIKDIEDTIRFYRFEKQVEYVFYDYLSSSMKIMAEGAQKTKMSGLREDQILLMFAQRLKDLSTSLGLHIQSSTQLNGEWKNAQEVNQNLLRGAKSIADKIDIGVVLMPTRESDKVPIESATASKKFMNVPNSVMHIYKVRRGKWNSIRIYGYFDKATCRWEDCFCTDSNGYLVDIERCCIEEVLDKTATETLFGDVAQSIPFSF